MGTSTLDEGSPGPNASPSMAVGVGLAFAAAHGVAWWTVRDDPSHLMQWFAFVLAGAGLISAVAGVAAAGLIWAANRPR